MAASLHDSSQRVEAFVSQHGGAGGHSRTSVPHNTDVQLAAVCRPGVNVAGCDGDVFREGRFASSSSSRGDGRSERQGRRRDRVNRAFADLQREMREAAAAQQQQGRRYGRFGAWAGMGPDNFDEVVDREAVKKWLDRAFDLASEWNQDFAPSPADRDSNGEVLEKSREWVEKMYQQGAESPDGTASAAATAEAGSRDDADEARASGQGDSEPSPPKPKEPRPESPYSEDRSSDGVFEVAVDLPGVERPDIDIALEGDFLTIEALRRPREEGQVGRKYVKKFELAEVDVDVDEIEATLDSGVLIVKAPKKKKEETKRKIPIM